MISLTKRCVSELIGTFFLVFFGTGAAVVTLMLSKGVTTTTAFNAGIGAIGGLGDWLAVALAFGLVITAMIYALGNISGCHINPAVTIALWAIKKFPGSDVLPYIVAQSIGAVLGSLVLLFALGMDAATIGGLGATAPFAGVGYLQAIVIEFLGTFVLMMAILGVSDERSVPGFSGLVIGLTVAGVIITIGNMTGGSINPARTFGPYLAATLAGTANLWNFFPIYLIGPIFGAIAAAFIYSYVSSDDS